MNATAAGGVSQDDSLLAEAVDEFMDAQRRGEACEVDEFARRYPPVAEMLRQVLPALMLMQPDGELSGVSEGSWESAGVSEVSRAPLGDYRILREVGRGGMGVVYEAEQLSLDRRVALKVLPFAAALDARHLQRFKTEAQAAAQLQHQNIVPVYAVGCERGVHYYAMQFIDGQPLSDVIADLHRLEAGEIPADDGALSGLQATVLQNAACGDGASTPPETPATSSAAANDTACPAKAATSADLSLQSRGYYRTVASLGIQAAEGLEHAHGLGVVHRDVKPANLLLDVRGNLWITDFGLAQVQSDGKLTMTGDVIGTLRYMSPEQALGGRTAIDHRTDVYSLGVTLYELLTLRPAFPGDNRQDLLRRIADDEPERPRRVNKAVPPELETIVLKAMSKTPGDRYATAGDLAEDLTRFLDDKPILARRPGLLTRVRKYARRHQAVVATATIAAFILLLTATIVLGVSNLFIQRERDEKDFALTAKADALKAEAAERTRAEENLRQARKAVKDFFTLVSQSPQLELRALQTLRKELLETALAYYREFLKQRGDDPHLKLELAATQFQVSEIYLALGRTDDAVDAMVAAQAIVGELRASGAATADFRPLGGVFKGFRRTHMRGPMPRDPEQALRLLLALAAQWEEFGKAFPQAPEFRNDLGMLNLYTGELLRSGGRHRQAIPALRRAFQVYTELTRRYPAVPDYAANLATALWGYGRALTMSQQHKQAAESYEAALKIREKLVAAHPSVPGHRLHLAESLRMRGEMQRVRGNQQDANADLRRSLKIAESLVADFPGVPYYTETLITCLGFLADQLRVTSQTAEALACYRRMVDLLAATKRDGRLGDGEPAKWRAALLAYAGMLQRAAATDTLARNWTKAEAAYRDAANVFELLLSLNAQPADVETGYATCLIFLARVLSRAKQPKQARELLESQIAKLTAQAELLHVKPEAKVAQAGRCWRLTWLLIESGKFEQAEQAGLRAVKLHEELARSKPDQASYRQKLGENHWRLARVYNRMDRPDGAEREFRKSLATYRALVKQHPKRFFYQQEVGYTHWQLAWLFERRNRLKDAEAEYRAGLAVYQQAAKSFPKVSLLRMRTVQSQQMLQRLLARMSKAKKSPKSLPMVPATKSEP